MELSGQLHAPAVLATGTHWIRGRVGPRSVLDSVVVTVVFLIYAKESVVVLCINLTSLILLLCRRNGHISCNSLNFGKFQLHSCKWVKF
jgi:hypothetical protein